MELQWETGGQPSARPRMRGCLTATIVPAGMLAGLSTVQDCMRDETLRAFLGHALLAEIMPCMGLDKAEVERLAIAACQEMERPGEARPLADLARNGARAWARQALPFLIRYQEQKGRAPSCLCMGLAALIMLFAGARRQPDGRFAILREGEPCPVEEDERTLLSFSRLSCDMPPETLAYAALSDQAIWERDLREIPGLEETLAGQLRDLQLMGLRAALKRAWETIE